MAHIIKEHLSSVKKAKLITISYYYPDFKYLANIVAAVQSPEKDSKWADDFYAYYRMTVDYFPEIDSTHFLLGFCKYYRNDIDAARGEFEESVQLNPYFFWSYYNLGVIYFNQGDFLKSAEILSKAISVDNEITLAVLHQNSFYQQIWLRLADPGQTLEENLRDGKKDALLVLADCMLKGGFYSQSLEIISSAEKASFNHQQVWVKLYQKAVEKKASTEVIDRLISDQVAVRLF